MNSFAGGIIVQLIINTIFMVATSHAFVLKGCVSKSHTVRDINVGHLGFFRILHVKPLLKRSFLNQLC